jgi:hypothetical protein
MEVERTIKVISYNILCDKWAIYHEDDPTTHKLKDRYAFIPDDQKELVLNWEYRLARIIQKITDYDPDIICLQEVYLPDLELDFAKNLPDYCYISHLIWDQSLGSKVYKRTNTIGNVTLWKNNKFCCLTHPHHSFNSTAVFSELVYKKTDFAFMIVNVHLKAGLHSGAEVRAQQIASCLKMINNIPVCICGDFNEELHLDLPAKQLLAKNNFTFGSSQITCDVYSCDTNIHHYHAFDHAIGRHLDIGIDPTPNPEPLPSLSEPSDHYALLFKIKIPDPVETNTYCEYSTFNENGILVWKKKEHLVYNRRGCCSVCLENYITETSPGYVNRCGHWLCLKCFLITHKEHTYCPICHDQLDFSTIKVFGGKNIFVKSISGKDLYYAVDLDNTTGAELKELYTIKEGPVGYFIYRGKIIYEDSKSLALYGMKDGSMCHANMRLKGD